MTVRDELLTIKGDDEVLQTETVWAWARDNPASDLHRSINWDVEDAAKQHQLWQIRRLIAIHIVNADTGQREAVSLSIDRTRGGGYRMVDDVIPVVDLRECMLQDALRDLQRLETKYSRLQELARVWDEAETAAAAARARAATRGRRRIGRRTGDEGRVST